MEGDFDDAVGAEPIVEESGPGSLDRLRQQLAAAHLEIGHLEVGLGHRAVIGQATGMVMERFALDAPAALDVLRRLSQESNRKLHEIAADLVTTSLLDLGGTPRSPHAVAGENADESAGDKTSSAPPDPIG